MKSLLPVLFAAFAIACGSTTTPTAPKVVQPTTLNVAGTWTGTYASGQLGFGTATLALTQAGTTVGGTWSSAPSPGGGADIGAGTVSGTNPLTGNSGTFTLTLSPSNPTFCPFRSTMTVFLAERQMTGEWVTVTCTVTASGTLILKKN